MILPHGQLMLKVGIRYPIPLWQSPLDKSPFHRTNTMLSSVAYSIVTLTISLSTMLTLPMFPTFSHLSLNGNSLARLRLILPARGESFGLITQLSLPSPLAVGLTTTAITLQCLKISLNTFKRRSLKNLTLIGILSSFTKLSLLLFFIATKLSVGNLPIILIGSSKSVRSLLFFSPSGTTKQVFRRYLKPLPDVLPLPWNLPTRWLRTLKKECGHRIPYIVYSKRKPAAPDLEADFPPMAASVAAPAKAPPNIPAAKARQSAIATMSFAPPPAYTPEEVSAPTVVPTATLPDAAAPSHLSSASVRGLQNSGAAPYCSPSSTTTHRESHRKT